MIQSFLALGGGGSVGMGLGEGRQKLFFLPYPHTDFIYAVIGEELGLVGTVIVLILFGILAWRGMAISLKAPDPFGRHLAFGLTMMIILQALINMAVVTGLLPTKGLTLPFLSYGGSSLLANLIGIGILWNISRAAAEKSTMGYREKVRSGSVFRAARRERAISRFAAEPREARGLGGARAPRYNKESEGCA
jgi:cell division protein FtsW